MDCIETQGMKLMSSEWEKIYPIPDLVKGHRHLRNTLLYITYHGFFARFLNQR